MERNNGNKAWSFLYNYLSRLNFVRFKKVWNLQKRIEELKHQLSFLKKCKNNGLMPKSCEFCISNKKINKNINLNNKIKETILNWFIKEKYNSVDNCIKKYNRLKNMLRRDVYKEIFEDIKYQLLDHNKKLVDGLKKKYDKKWDWLTRKHKNLEDGLCESNIGSDNCVKERAKIVNLSNTEFDNDQLEILNKGKKYIPFVSGDIHKETVVSVEAADIKDEFKIELQSKINNVINIKKGFNKKEWKEKCIIKTIVEKMNNEKLIITCEDKGNRFVILKEHEYNKKINEDIIKQGYEEIYKDPGNKIKTQYKVVLNYMKEKKLINCKEYRWLYPTAFMHPYIFGKIKTHKENMAARVIVNFDNHILKNLCTIIYKKIVAVIGYGIYSIKNSEEIVMKLNNIKLNRNSLIASLDVEKMYQSVPRDESINLVISMLEKSGRISKEWIYTIKEALRIISESLYFKYKDRFWNIKKGWVMGCSISGLLSSMFINNLEEKIVGKYIKNKEIMRYYRYVDDIIIIGNSRSILKIFNKLNDNIYKIKFTIEKEERGLKYLDIYLNRNKKNEIEVKQYIKDVEIRGIIDPSSYQPWSQKMSVLKGFKIKNDRLTINKKESLEQKMNIEMDYVKMGYNKKDIRKVLYCKDKIKYGERKKENKDGWINNKWISIPYYKDVYKILRKGKLNENIRIAWKNNKSLEKWITNVKRENNKESKIGLVYKIICRICGKIYIGQTGKTAIERGKEHNKAIDRRDMNSGPYVHYLNTGHKMRCIEDMEVIKYVKDYNKRKYYETLYIQENMSKCVNLVKGPAKLSSKWALKDNWKI